AATTPGVAPDRQAVRAGLLALRERPLLVGLWLITLPALLFGVLIVLVPLRLSEHGWGTIAIGALFLATTGLETILNPMLGRLTDRHGRMRPVRAALIGSIIVSVALAGATQPALIAPLVLASGIAYGAFYTPGPALISHGAEQAGVAQGLAFGLMNACWGIGALIGPASGRARSATATRARPAATDRMASPRRSRRRRRRPSRLGTRRPGSASAASMKAPAARVNGCRRASPPSPRSGYASTSRRSRGATRAASPTWGPPLSAAATGFASSRPVATSG